ncbi:sensor histidine kinase [Pacificimonas sp. ICDLI1SI03]
MSTSPAPGHDDSETSGPEIHGRSLSTQFLQALSLALLPIGLLAALLSVSSFMNARDDAIKRVEERGTQLARVVSDVFQDRGLVLRALVLQRPARERIEGACARELSRFVELDRLFSALYRLDRDGNVICKSTQGGALSPVEIDRVRSIELQTSELGSALFFSEQRNNMIFAVRGGSDAPQGDSIVGVVPISSLRAELANVVRPSGSTLTIQVADGMEITEESTVPTLQEDGSYGLIAPTRLGGLAVNYSEPLSPFRWSVIAGIFVPPFMWLAALLISWATLRRSVLRPLRNMRAGLERRAAGDDTITLVDRAGSTGEFLEFAAAYDRLAADQKAGRKQREAAIAAQSRLIREVHHRVKNNLQIITSLISVKSRATLDPGQQRAYGTIQMRVTALAHVHRWLYADDVTKGVDLAALINDLSTGLETSVESTEGVSTHISTSLDGVFVGQDAAVPVSFLITELIAATGTRLGDGHQMSVNIALSRTDETCARLTLTSQEFRGADIFAVSERTASARILQGMVRQLRAKFKHDAEAGQYLVDFPTDPV